VALLHHTPVLKVAFELCAPIGDAGIPGEAPADGPGGQGPRPGIEDPDFRVRQKGDDRD
jgi:hypothetical protein